jgi:hypothetical protein
MLKIDEWWVCKEPEIPQPVIPPTDVCPYRFVIEGGTKRTTLWFGPTETIQDAKDRLGKHISVDPKQITLLLTGKLLKETDLLKRPCKPGHQIVAL